MLRLALHDWVIAWDRRTGAAWLAARAVDGDSARAEVRIRAVLERVAFLARRRGAGRRPEPRGRPGTTTPRRRAFVSGTSRARWVDGVEAVRSAIARGEIYQANLTRRLEARFAGDPWPLFRRLRTGDPALFAGYLDLGPSPATGARRALLSASPEPFLAVDGDGERGHGPDQGHAPPRPDAGRGPGAGP